MIHPVYQHQFGAFCFALKKEHRADPGKLPPGFFQGLLSTFSTLKLSARAETQQICAALISQPIVRAFTLTAVDFRQQSQHADV